MQICIEKNLVINGPEVCFETAWTKRLILVFIDIFQFIKMCVYIEL